MILLCGPTSRTSLPSAATGHCPARFGHRRHHNQAITVAPGRELEPTPPPPPLCHQSATTSTRRCLCSIIKSKRERGGERERRRRNGVSPRPQVAQGQFLARIVLVCLDVGLLVFYYFVFLRWFSFQSSNESLRLLKRFCMAANSRFSIVISRLLLLI
jgi:hypothetical protein